MTEKQPTLIELLQMLDRSGIKRVQFAPSMISRPAMNARTYWQQWTHPEVLGGGRG